MNPSNLQAWRELAEDAAQKAGALMLERLKHPMELKSKGFRDIVTAVDYEAQALITTMIREAFPEHGFLTEEEDSTLPEDGPVRWVIDPIDGTSNYARGIPSFCTSIAAAVDDDVVVGVVYDPNLDELFSASKNAGTTLNGELVTCSDINDFGDVIVALDWSRATEDRKRIFDALLSFGLDVRSIRGTGSAALALAWVAAGRFDGYANLTLSPWDWAAAGLMIEEAGGRFTQPNGEKVTLTQPCGTIAGTSLIFEELRERVAQVTKS